MVFGLAVVVRVLRVLGPVVGAPLLVVLVVFGLGSVVLAELGLLELGMDSEVEGFVAFGTAVLPGMGSVLLGQLAVLYDPAVLWSVGYLRLGLVVCRRPQRQPRVPFWGLVVTQRACYHRNCVSVSVFYHACVCRQVASSHGKHSSPLHLRILEQKRCPRTPG